MSKKMNKTQNPLSAYFRAPKLFTKIPSGGKFYEEGIIEFNDDTSFELAIYPMTTKDELLLKNPDALLNGEAVASLIQSCVPEVKNARNLYSADVDALLIAIRGASGGDDVEVSGTCPKCETTTDVTVSVAQSLQNMEEVKDLYQITLANGLVISGMPFSYKNTIKAGVASFQSTRSMQSISSLTDDMERLKAFNDSFVKLADLNFELLIDAIYSVVYQDEEGEDVSIDDKVIIREFLENTDNTVGKEIEAFINSINAKGVNTEVQIECGNEECEETYVSTINFDPVNFFTGS
jgi:hypothetical protein|tara:strand:+ start:943 stop:1821 length:879 start_codon:yes stop_codon:yes gene_type:complete